jgi:hypothetical protein
MWQKAVFAPQYTRSIFMQPGDEIWVKIGQAQAIVTRSLADGGVSSQVCYQVNQYDQEHECDMWIGATELKLLPEFAEQPPYVLIFPDHFVGPTQATDMH